MSTERECGYECLGIIDADNVTLPYDLQKFEDDLKKIKRFEGKLPDNVLEHTARAVAIARYLASDNSELQRMIWVHDIPEIVVGDVIITKKAATIPDKDEPEMRAAAELLNSEDLKLFARFRNAERFLYDGEVECVDATAILACIIEKVEGNVFYHHHVSQTRQELFGISAVEYTQEQKEKFEEKLKKALPDCEEKAAAMLLLELQMHYVNRLWGEI